MIEYPEEVWSMQLRNGVYILNSSGFRATDGAFLFRVLGCAEHRHGVFLTDREIDFNFRSISEYDYNSYRLVI